MTDLDLTDDYAYAYGRAHRLAEILLEDLAAGRAIDLEFNRTQLAEMDAVLRGPEDRGLDVRIHRLGESV